MPSSRLNIIQDYSGNGKLEKLRKIFEIHFTQLEIDVALEAAIAYSKINVAEYLLTLGADFSNYNYQGIYYAVHNDELEGVKFSIAHGVDINLNEGMLLNESILTSINSKNIRITKWLLENQAAIEKLTEQSINLIKLHGSDELRTLIKQYQKN